MRGHEAARGQRRDVSTGSYRLLRVPLASALKRSIYLLNIKGTQDMDPCLI